MQKTLRFTPYSWSKLIYLRDIGDTEIGCFGIAENPNEPLLITDLKIIKQNCTSVSVQFDDESIADMFDDLVDAGMRPEQFGRIWIHTHPDIGAAPSGVDEKTFQRVFGECNWAVMFILAKGGETYCRIRYGVGAKSQVILESEVDYSQNFGSSDFELWKKEYELEVTSVETVWEKSSNGTHTKSGSGTHKTIPANYVPQYFEIDKFLGKLDDPDDSEDYIKPDLDDMEREEESAQILHKADLHSSEECRLQEYADDLHMSIEEAYEIAERGIDY